MEELAEFPWREAASLIAAARRGMVFLQWYLQNALTRKDTMEHCGT